MGKKELKYIKQEINWFLGRDYKPIEYFVNRDGPNSNYGAMCLKHQNYAGYTQIQWCEDKLKADKNTRQAVTFYNSPEYQYKGNIDFVCTLTQMFSIKNDRLNTTINIRSSDILNGFRYDMIWYRVYQQLLCDKLKFSYPELDIGSMTFNIFSAHYYLRDEALLERIFKRAEKDKFEKLSINDLL